MFINFKVFILFIVVIVISILLKATLNKHNFGFDLPDFTRAVEEMNITSTVNITSTMNITSTGTVNITSTNWFTSFE